MAQREAGSKFSGWKSGLLSNHHTCLCKCLQQDQGVKMSGALRYSAGLSLFPENPSTCVLAGPSCNWLSFISFDLQSRTLRGKLTLLIWFKWCNSSQYLDTLVTSFSLKDALCTHFSPPPCVVLRELWHYLLWRSPCCSSLCLCFDSNNSWAYMGSRHWPGDHKIREACSYIVNTQAPTRSETALNGWQMKTGLWHRSK